MIKDGIKDLGWAVLFFICLGLLLGFGTVIVTGNTEPPRVSCADFRNCYEKRISELRHSEEPVTFQGLQSIAQYDSAKALQELAKFFKSERPVSSKEYKNADRR